MQAQGSTSPIPVLLKPDVISSYINGWKKLGNISWYYLESFW